MPLPIGFFSPLPLPVMIPFMALQSFAMMYAAGTGWQYGKRKISSLTNETFNNITPVQLNAEILGSIHDMIPSFEQSAQQMSEMNKVIFEQMRLMISDATNFFGELVFGMFSGIAKDATDFFSGGTPPPTNSGIELISDTGETSIFTPEIENKYSQAIFRAMPLDELIKGINSGRFTGSDLSLAKHTLSTRQEPTDQTLVPTIATNQQKEHQAWQNKLSDLQRKLVTTSTAIAHTQSRINAGLGNSTALSNLIAKQRGLKRSTASKIRLMSNDYRHPNNAIRRDALTLRQQIANGLLK